MWPLILTLLLGTGAALAQPQRYLGGALFFNSNGAGSNINLFGTSEDERRLAAQRGVGGEVNVGLGGSIWKAYAGLAFSRSSGSDKASYVNIEDERVETDGDFDTNDLRLLLGGRLHFAQRGKMNIVPAIGAGISFNRVERFYSAVETIGGQTPVTIDDYASDFARTGYFIEGGLMHRLITGGQVSLFARTHFVSADFGKGSAIEDDLEASIMFLLGYWHPF